MWLVGLLCVSVPLRLTQQWAGFEPLIHRAFFVELVLPVCCHCRRLPYCALVFVEIVTFRTAVDIPTRGPRSTTRNSTSTTEEIVLVVLRMILTYTVSQTLI